MLPLATGQVQTDSLPAPHIIATLFFKKISIVPKFVGNSWVNFMHIKTGLLSVSYCRNKSSGYKSNHTNLDLSHYRHQHNHNWAATQKLPTIYILYAADVALGSLRRVALSATTALIEYNKMLLP
jgi:hypothetical protein